MVGLWTGGDDVWAYACAMRRVGLVAVLGLVGASGAMAAPAVPSMCDAGATALFSCAVGHKVVSICGEGGKATYYYGVPGKVEMSSQALVFAERMFSGGGETQISFANGAYSYVVFDKTVRTSFSADGHNDPDSTSGLVVLKGGKTLSAKACASDATISADASKMIQAGAFVEH